MRLLQYLQEEYIGKVKGWAPGKNRQSIDFPVFINPTPKELKEFDEVRFIVDNDTKKVFVSNSYFYHEPFVTFLQKNSQIKTWQESYMGAGTVDRGKIHIDHSSYDYKIPQNLKEFMWAGKYFTNLNDIIDKYIRTGIIKEEYCTMTKALGNPVEIYRNPTKADRIALYKSLSTRAIGIPDMRYLADPIAKDLFLFSFELLHAEAYRVIQREGYFKKADLLDCFAHFCRIAPNGDILQQYYNTKVQHYMFDEPKWSWLKVYFK